MNRPMYAVHDVKAGLYMVPFFSLNDAMAMRSFVAACRTESQDIGKFPLDFSLHRVGVFDEEKGIVEPEGPVFLMSGAEALSVKE